MNRQHSLFLCVVDPIVQLAKEFSKDPTTLLKLHMHQTTTSNKLFGVSKTMQDQLVVKLKNVPFSLNLDEATSTNLLRVFSVLVSSYDKEKHSLVVEQLASLSISVVDGENLFRELQSVFLQFNLLWENLMVMMLRDSASVMRGEKNGLEKRVRDLAPHLIDIDGDSCHHMHNIVKNFTNHFDKFLEGLFRRTLEHLQTLWRC